MSTIKSHSFKLAPPMLIMVMGLPGSGKSYFARAFAEKIGGMHFNSDIIRKQQQEYQHTARLTAPPQSSSDTRGTPYRGGQKYSASSKSQVYKTMFQQVCQALEEGQIVVVDATFSLQQYRDPYVNFAKENRIPLRIIMICADEKIIHQRLQHSRPDSDADFEVYKKIRSEFEPLNQDYLQLNSHQHSLDALMEQGLSYLVDSAP